MTPSAYSAAGLLSEQTAGLHAARALLARALRPLEGSYASPLDVSLAVEEIMQVAVILDQAIGAALVLTGPVEDGEAALRELERIAMITVGEVDAGTITIYDIVKGAATFLDRPEDAS